jgi:hypothetical protein
MWALGDDAHAHRGDHWLRSATAQHVGAITINNNLPAPVAASAAGPVVGWVAANCAGLLDFWNNGETWTRAEVNAFFDGLRKVG